MLKLAKLNGQPEIFHTIQGEGKNLGKPSVFIRLTLCNLYCVWCDTDHTWNWENTNYKHVNDAKPGYKKFKKEEQILSQTKEDLLEKVAAYQCANLVITGGEPLVQKKDLLPFLLLLKEQDPNYHIEIETNGTLMPGEALDGLIDQYNVSTKLSNSGVTEQERLVEDVMYWFAYSPKSNFKFVIDTEKDLMEVAALDHKYGILPQNIYLMPQGTSAEALQEKGQWLVEQCKQHGYNYTDRLHIHLYGNRRGV